MHLLVEIPQKIGTNEMFKEKEAKKYIPLSYLELVMDTINKSRAKKTQIQGVADLFKSALPTD